MSKSPSLRRIQADIRELALDPSDQYHASPLENDMFEWHFTIRGAKGTDFEGGIYHGRILLPPEYPFKPPHIMLLTPSGRFETNTKVCLSFSAYHPELWQPAWGIRLILEALISFLETPADGAIGALDWSSAERKRLAKQSVDWCCPLCGKITALIPVKAEKSDNSEESSTPAKPSRFAREIQELQRLQMQQHTKEEEAKGENDAAALKPADKEGIEGEESNRESDPDTTTEPNVEDKKDSQAEVKVDPDTTTEPKAEDKKKSQAEVKVDPAEGSKEEVIPDTAAADVTQEDDKSLVAAAAAMEHSAAVVPSSRWMSVVDPLMQLIIVVLSAICFILLRKIQGICVELQALDNE